MSTTQSRQIFAGAASAYDLARTLLALGGIQNADQAYAACPDMLPRTVRRIFEQGRVLDIKKDADLMDMDLSSPEIHKPLPDSIETEAVNNLTAKAAEAKVNIKSAVTAVLRFGNPVERVMKVLDDIKALGARAKNPSGLFVFAMRHGSDIKLPESVEARQDAAKPKHAPLSVGEWVKWNCEWMKVMVIKGLQVLLSPSDDMDDTYKINADQILHLPRKDALPRGADRAGS